MTNNEPYLRKKISTSLVFSAAITLLLLSSPMLFFNPLLQPVQAQTTTMTFKTPQPITSADGSIVLAFDIQGTLSSPTHVDVTNGTIQIQGFFPTGGIVAGTVGSKGVTFINDSRGAPSFDFNANFGNNGNYLVSSQCGTAQDNAINFGQGAVSLNGPVECSSSQGGGNTTSSSMAGTTTPAQDSDGDGDGIADSSDKCTHNSNPKCYKEGDSITTTQQERPSSNSTGNQTG